MEETDLRLERIEAKLKRLEQKEIECDQIKIRIKSERTKLIEERNKIESNRRSLFNDVSITCITMDQQDYINPYRTQYLERNDIILPYSRSPDGSLTNLVAEFINLIKSPTSNVYIGRGVFIFILSIYLRNRTKTTNLTYLYQVIRTRFTTNTRFCPDCGVRVKYYNLQINPDLIPPYFHTLPGENLLDI